MFSLAFMATTLVLATQTTDYKVIVDRNGRAGRRYHSQGSWLQNSPKQPQNQEYQPSRLF